MRTIANDLNASGVPSPCRAGNGAVALAIMRQLMERLGLTVNDQKTRLACLPEEAFDFLGMRAAKGAHQRKLTSSCGQGSS
jgi:hypothetical protein